MNTSVSAIHPKNAAIAVRPYAFVTNEGALGLVSQHFFTGIGMEGEQPEYRLSCLCVQQAYCKLQLEYGGSFPE